VVTTLQELVCQELSLDIHTHGYTSDVAQRTIVERSILVEVDLRGNNASGVSVSRTFVGHPYSWIHFRCCAKNCCWMFGTRG
jgi:hypothetical protein